MPYLSAPVSPYLVPFDGSFQLKKAASAPPDGAPDKATATAALARCVEEISELQRQLYAQNQRSLLLVFQAIDAAGKDGTIRAVLTGINPAGCEVHAFKPPSEEELDHDFLWRVNRALPERGRIGVFNRSHYEEVLAVRVHPAFLEKQRLPSSSPPKRLWNERYRSIRGFERHLARNGTTVLKFWLHVSKDEQRRRLLERIDDPKANWKFQAGDIDERNQWDNYMKAYEDALNATSRKFSPWYAIPADNKPVMRLIVATIFLDALRGMRLSYPTLRKKERDELKVLRNLIV